MDETETLTEKIKILTHQVHQRDSEISSLRKQLLQLRSGYSDKAGEKQCGKAISDLPEASEKEIQKRVNEEVEKREKKFNEKFREMQLKYEKELFTAKQMYDSVATKVESAMVQERTIEAMTRDIKILEDEKKNMKLLHLEILKHNQIELEIKHAEAKKKMLEEIKKVQHNVSLSYLQQMDNSQKLTFLRNNQLEKEIDYRSVRMEELILKNEKYEGKIFELSQELESTKKSFLNVTQKNKKMGDLIRNLTESLVNLQKEKDEEINKLCVLCEIEPEKLRSLGINSGSDLNIKSTSSRAISKKNKSFNGSFRKKMSKSNKKSPKKLSNFNSINSNISVPNDNLQENNLEIENFENINKDNDVYSGNDCNKANLEEDKIINHNRMLNINVIKENENENDNENNSVLNKQFDKIGMNDSNSNMENNSQEKYITSGNNFYSKSQITSEKNLANTYFALNSPVSINNKYQIQEDNSDLNASPKEIDNDDALNNKQKSFIDKENFGKEIKTLPIMQMGSAAQQRSTVYAKNSSTFINSNNANNIKSLHSSTSFGLYPFKNREYISSAGLLNSVVFSKSNSNNSLTNSFKIVGFENPNLNLASNNNNTNNELNSNNNINNNLNNLNSSQINPLLNSINKSITYSCNRVSGFARENNLYQIYEKKIKNLESAMRDKEKELFRLKISFDNLNEKLISYEKKFQGIISLYEAGLKKLMEEEEALKNFTIVDFNFDFSTLKNFEFQKLSNQNKFNLLVFLLNQIIPLINVNELESEYIKQNISMLKFKFYEEKLKNTAEKDNFFRNSVSNFSRVKSLKEGKNPMNYVNGTLRNMHYNASSVGNINTKFKAPINYLKDEKLSLTRKLNMYDYQVID